MRDITEKEQVRELRYQGVGVERIAALTSVPIRTVRRWVDDIPFDLRDNYLQSVEEQMASRFPKKRGDVRKRLISERGHQCQVCKNTEWMGKPIALEMHRIEQGGAYVRENVILMCPNCHAQTDSWRRSNNAEVVERNTR